ASPFVRKCLVVASELGLADRIEKLPSAAHPINRDPIIIETNPLGQVPTFFTDDGLAIFDSRVICEYLNNLVQGPIFPKESQDRWLTLTEQSLADGVLDAALLARSETAVRPEQLHRTAWTQSQLEKIGSALDYFEGVADQR